VTNYVYVIENTVNSSYYVGKTQDVERRFASHLKEGEKGNYHSRIANSIRKHGKENFNIQVIEECGENWREREKYWIQLYRELAGNHCLNMTEGGDGGDFFSGRAHSDETKRKISEALKGKVLCDETKQKMSEAQKGKKLSDETKFKISLFHKGKKLSKVQLEKLSKRVKETNTGLIFDSIRLASEYFNVSRHVINGCCEKNAGNKLYRESAVIQAKSKGIDFIYFIVEANKNA